MKSFLTHFDLKSILPLIIGHFGTGVPLKSLGSYPTANLPPEIEEIHNEIQKRLIGGTGPAADRALSAYMALLSVDGCVEARLFSGVPITTAYSLKMGKTSSQSEEVAVGHDVECLSAFRDNYADYAGVDLSCFYLTKYSSITPKILRKPTWGIYLCQCWFVPDRDAFVAFANSRGVNKEEADFFIDREPSDALLGFLPDIDGNMANEIGVEMHFAMHGSLSQKNWLNAAEMWLRGADRRIKSGNPFSEKIDEKVKEIVEQIKN